MRTVEQFDELVCVTYDDLQQSARESEKEMEAARTRGRPLEAAQKPRTAADLDLGGGRNIRSRGFLGGAVNGFEKCAVQSCTVEILATSPYRICRGCH
jgi:hypothetical protein